LAETHQPPPPPHVGWYTRVLLVIDRPVSLNCTCKYFRPKKKKKASQENGGGEGQSAAAFQPNEVEIIFKPHASLTPELGKQNLIMLSELDKFHVCCVDLRLPVEPGTEPFGTSVAGTLPIITLRLGLSSVSYVPYRTVMSQTGSTLIRFRSI
jgi:hypothetical protein